MQRPESPAVLKLDGNDRVADFLSRHGGAGRQLEEAGDMEQHTRGWTELFAADGYTLRCEWSKVGTKTEMNFVEIAPLTLDGSKN